MPYTKLTDFSVKDALTTGNPAKIIKGTEIDDEFDAIVTAFTGYKTTADFIATSGAGLSGFSQAVTYAAGTVGLHLKGFVSVTDAPYNADSTGVADSTAAFTAALAASQYVYVPPGTYKKALVHTLAPYQQIYGAGIGVTSIVMTNDSVAFVMQYWSQLRNLQISKSGAHTKNLVEVGSAALDGGRSLISDVLTTGAGNDGIQLIFGNLAMLQNIVSTSNGRDGINFKAGNGDLNACVLQGYIDVRGNVRDGLIFEPGATLGDNLCSKSNFANYVVAQSNGRYGVNIGTRSNIITCYAETNTTSDVYLSAYARGNDVKTVEGQIVDASTNPQFNNIKNYNASGGYQRIAQNLTLFSGVSTAGLQIFNDDGASGTVQLNKTAANAYQLATSNSGGLHTFTFGSLDGATNWRFKGNTFPTTDNTVELGDSNFRWSQVYAGNLVASTAATNQGAGTVTIGGTTSSTIGAAGAASALPANPLGYLISYVGTVQVKIPYYTA